MWFEKLTGFKEESPNQVRENIFLEDEYLISKINNNKYACGVLEIPSLFALRKKIKNINNTVSAEIKLQEYIGDVQNLHKSEENIGALFQR